MVDVETFGTFAGAVVASIGWCRFSEAGDYAPGKVNVSIQSALRAGLRVDGRTIEWWLRQEDAARAALFDPQPVPLRDALEELAKAVEGAKAVWAKPPQFDVAILDRAYAAVGRPVPWRRQSERCLRTLCSLAAKLSGQNPYEGIVAEPKHCAAADALAQTKAAVRAMDLLRGRAG